MFENTNFYMQKPRCIYPTQDLRSSAFGYTGRISSIELNWSSMERAAHVKCVTSEGEN